MKTYQEYDSEIESCDNIIKMLSKTIDDLKKKKYKIQELRKMAYEKVHPRCKSSKEFEYATSHRWYETKQCILDDGHTGYHISGKDYSAEQWR